MTDQLQLVEEPPAPLTERQKQALDHLKAAGPDGLTAAELGEALYGERPEARSWGNTAAQALRRKGLAVQRGRARVWVALTEPETTVGDPLAAAAGHDSGSVSDRPPDGLPVFNSMPKGY